MKSRASCEFTGVSNGYTAWWKLLETSNSVQPMEMEFIEIPMVCYNHWSWRNGSVDGNSEVRQALQFGAEGAPQSRSEFAVLRQDLRVGVSSIAIAWQVVMVGR